jgi:hypothetical protein
MVVAYEIYNKHLSNIKIAVSLYIYYCTLHMFLLYKSNKTIWIFTENMLTRETTHWTTQTSIM